MIVKFKKLGNHYAISSIYADNSTAPYVPSYYFGIAHTEIENKFTKDFKSIEFRKKHPRDFRFLFNDKDDEAHFLFLNIMGVEI